MISRHIYGQVDTKPGGKGQEKMSLQKNATQLFSSLYSLCESIIVVLTAKMTSLCKRGHWGSNDNFKDGQS